MGGTHGADHITWIIRRAKELQPRWEELAGELRYGVADGFYVYGQPRVRARTTAEPAPGARPEPLPGGKRLAVPTDEEAPWRRVIARALDRLGRLFPVSRETALRRALARLAGWVDGRPPLARAIEALELA